VIIARHLILWALFILIVSSFLMNGYEAVHDDNIHNAFFAGIFFWIIIDYAFKAMVIDKIKGEK